MSTRKSGALMYLLQYVMMFLMSVIFVFPLIWMVSKSFMGLPDLYAVPPRLFPSKIVMDAYNQIWSIKPFHLFFLNTIIIVVSVVIGSVFSSALCAFGFARIRFPLRGPIFAVVLGTMMLPSAVTMIPLYVLFSKLHWINTLLPLIIPAFFGGGAFNIFLLRQFFTSVPRDLDEAAKMDGAGTLAIFLRVCFPLCLPALTVVGVNAFIGSWNDFFGPLIYLNREEHFTLALGLLSMSAAGISVASITTAQLMAACGVTIIPVVLLFFFAQNKLISGTVISAGIKG